MAGGHPVAAMQAAEDLMNDFRIIRHSGENRALRAQDGARLNENSVDWLRGELTKRDPRRTVVVTHHAPSLQSEAPYHKASALSPAFVSELDQLVKASGVPIGNHGHTHYNVDYRLGTTRVLSNQRGDPTQLCKGFNPAMVVDVRQAG